MLAKCALLFARPTRSLAKFVPVIVATLSVGYNSDYIYRGIQWADENWTFDANYHFDCFGLGDLKLGIFHVNSLVEGAPFNFERTHLYSEYGLPIHPLGLDIALGYIHYIEEDAGALGNDHDEVSLQN